MSVGVIACSFTPIPSCSTSGKICLSVAHLAVFPRPFLPPSLSFPVPVILRSCWLFPSQKEIDDMFICFVHCALRFVFFLLLCVVVSCLLGAITACVQPLTVFLLSESPLSNYCSCMVLDQMSNERHRCFPFVFAYFLRILFLFCAVR